MLATTDLALSLTNWVQVATGTIDGDPLTISDLTATNYPKRFYSVSIGQ